MEGKLKMNKEVRTEGHERKTKVISAFPACGKSYFYNQNKESGMVLDSDSSEFSWIKDKNGNNTKERNPEFPQNYMQHIKNNIGKVDIIFVSSHDNVRAALKENSIEYTLVSPKIELKEEYIERYKKRGNDEGFITFISTKWEEFILEIQSQ